MKRRRKLVRTLFGVLTLSALAALAVYAGRRVWAPATPGPSPLTMTARVKDFALNIPCQGELQSTESVAVAVPVVPVQRLRIASVAPNGRRVNKGDVVVEFDPAELDVQMLEHRSDLSMVQHRLSRGELASGAEKTDIRKEKKLAELDLRKINEFLPQDETIYSRNQIIEGQLDKSYTEKRILFADGRLQLKDKVYSLDEAILRLEREQADTRITRVEKGLASLKLLSPASGIVVYRDEEFFVSGERLMPGRVVFVGMMLFRLVNPDTMEAKCFVHEKDAGELRAGPPVTVTLDPYPGVTFTGKVKGVDNLARPIDRDSPVKFFQTIVSLDRTDAALMKPGVKLKAHIRAGELKSVIMVPRSAAVKKDNGFVVFVQKGPGRFEPAPVQLGQGDRAQVAVTQGLQPGQVLALNPPDVKPDFSPGAKKKPGEGR